MRNPGYWFRNHRNRKHIRVGQHEGTKRTAVRGIAGIMDVRGRLVMLCRTNRPVVVIGMQQKSMRRL